MSWEFLHQAEYFEGLLVGLRLTLLLAMVSSVVSLIGGSVVAGVRVFGPRWTRIGVVAYVEVFRSTPMIVQMFFWYFGVAALLPPARFPHIYGGSYEFTVAGFALSLYGTAFVGEVIRGSLEAVPKGQWEAAQGTGLTRIQTVRYVIVPQAMRILLPAYGNEFIGLLKETAIAMTIAVPELTWQAQKIETDLFRGFEAISIITGTYLVLCLFSGLLFRGCEVWLAARWRMSATGMLAPADR